MATQDDGCVRDYLQYFAPGKRDEFLSQFDHPFVVVVEQPGAEESDALDQFSTRNRIPLRDLRAQGSRPGQLRVFKVTKKPGTAFPDMIHIGRARNCDIAIQSSSVSKLHAHIERNSITGSYHLVDDKSTNGTSVNGVTLAPGEKQMLRDGDRLGFGDVILTFHTPGGFHQFLGTVAG